MSKYYVYKHIRPDTGKIFYIGKGYGNRILSKQNRNKHWKNIVEKNNGVFIPIIIKSSLTEVEAIKLEIDTIKIIGKTNLVNYTDGGEGISGYKHTLETKDKMSKKAMGRIPYNKGKAGRKWSESEKLLQSQKLKGKVFSVEYRKKLSNSLKGNKNSSGIPSKKRKKLIDLKTGEIYESIKSASLALSLTISHLSHMLRGVIKNKTNLTYLN